MPSALPAMALLAALRAAGAAERAVVERRAGRDPSEQEDEAFVREALSEALVRLTRLATRLRLGQALPEPEDGAAALVAAFAQRMRLAEAGRDVRAAHQRLMSLYPAVPEALVEDARVLAAEAARLATADTVERVLGGHLDRLDAFTDALRAALVEAR